MSRKFPFYRQYDQKDCGPTCLRMISKYYGKSYDITYLREISHLASSGTTLGGLADAAEKIGFSTLALSVKYQDISESFPLPCIAHWRQRHYVVVYQATASKVIVGDPGYGLITYSKQDFLKGWIPNKALQEEAEGIVLLFETTPLFYESEPSANPQKSSLTSFLKRYFRPYQSYLFQLILGLFIASLLQLAFPFLTQQIVDTGINTRNLNFISLILIAQLVLFLSQSGISIIRSWILLHITSRMNLRMLSDFLIKLMNLPIAFFDSKTSGDILQRIQDHNRVQTFLSATTLDALFSFVTLTLFGSILLYFSIPIFILFFAGSSLYILWILIFMRKRAEIDYKYFDQASGNQSSTIQLINGMQEIKINGSEKRRRWEWEAIQARLFKLNIRSLSISQAQNEGGNFLNQIKNIFISFFAARAVINGDMTLGSMLSIQYIIGQMNVPIANFLTFIRTYQDAQLSIARLSEIHNKPDEEGKELLSISDLPKQKSIHLENVSFRYGSSSSEWILKNISLHIPEGKTTAIVGASGSGKTTLLKLLLKFHEPTSGQIQIGNTDLKNLSYSFWRSQCGVVMQEGYIFADSIARNISESDSNGSIDRITLQESVRIANISSFIEELPNGYNTRIGSSGIGISGGQKQRILIARAVYKKPEFIFFDEATSALDANNEAVIINNLENFFKNRTVVVVAHRLSTVKNAHQIVVLNNGEIVEIGTHNDLVERQGYYFSLVKNQLELGV
ncbi:peptidase domain-containing ABC transporter [Siphonobacter sp. SORGH_AS_1065]|uniref:peptidase domain-containing ABC transporter n=1 Tax=Siphonobacter sp. SORGH_AS_1065 TaxID=3041795 RepID=UPI002781F1F2|nr:peptidase domain-containing ABC transporter [Siphonobacter sp. SORGH_AS_1065]MDQ1087442.1 ATP-binding cassette subfamily B protein [Siphonobacter sp. SORGH_AS_1065]